MKFTRYNNPNRRTSTRTKKDPYLPCIANYNVFGTPEYAEDAKLCWTANSSKTYFVADNNGTLYGHDLSYSEADDIITYIKSNMSEQEFKDLEIEIIEDCRPIQTEKKEHKQKKIDNEFVR